MSSIRLGSADASSVKLINLSTSSARSSRSSRDRLSPVDAHIDIDDWPRYSEDPGPRERGHWATKDDGIMLSGDFVLPFFNCFLILAVSALESALTILNRRILMTGVWRFPYPITASSFQILCTHFTLIIISCLLRLLRPAFTYIGLESFMPPVPVQGNPAYRGRRSRLGPFAYLLPPYKGIAGRGLFEFHWPTVRRVFPLALILVLKILLSNVSIALTSLPKYVLARVHTVPLALLFTAIARTSHSLPTISSVLIGVTNLLITSIQPGPSASADSIAAGFFSAIFAGLYPILLLRTYQTLHRAPDLLKDAGQFLMPKYRPNAHLGPTDEPRQALTFWRLLHTVSLLAVMIHLPILFLTGELADISQNCYILDTPRFWSPMIGAAFCAAGLFFFNAILCMAVSPLTASFISIPRQALQLAVHNKHMPVHSWVGAVMCWLSTAWYAWVRVTERRPPKI